MKNMHSFLCFLLIIAVLAGSRAFADNQPLSISKDMSLSNYMPDIAVDSNTGNVLVVWRQYDYENPQFSRIQAALCKRMNDGTYAVGNARLISGENDKCSEPKVAYSAKSNSFLAVWLVDRTDEGEYQSDIQSRRIDMKGRPKGKIVEMLPSTDNSDYNIALTATNDAVRESVPKSEYLLVWQRIPIQSSELIKYGGLWSAHLTGAGRTVGNMNLVLKAQPGSNIGLIAQSYPNRLLTTDDGSMYLACHQEKYSDSVQGEDAFLVRLNSDGSFSKKLLLESENKPIDVRVAELSDKLFLTNWYSFGEGKSFNQAVKWNLKKFKKPYLPVGDEAYTTELVGLDGGGVFQVITGFFTQYTAQFNSKGKMIGTYTEWSFAFGLGNDFVAVKIPGTKQVFLAYSVYKGIDSEVKGYLFETK